MPRLCSSLICEHHDKSNICTADCKGSTQALSLLKVQAKFHPRIFRPPSGLFTRSAAFLSAVFYNSSAVIFELVHLLVESVAHLVGNCRICRGAVVVLARIVGQDMQPVLAEFVEERGVVVLYILEIFEHDILIILEDIEIIVFVLFTREDIGSRYSILDSLELFRASCGVSGFRQCV